MDQGPLVKEQIDAGNKLLAEFERLVPVQAAFWLRTSEEDSWYLYITSDQFKDKNVDVAYGEVLRLAGEMRDPNFDPFRVKLIRSSHPLAKAALDILRRFPGRMATHFNGRNFAGVSVDGVYIYPTPITVT